jgi:6-phosphogluconolactonase
MVTTSMREPDVSIVEASELPLRAAERVADVVCDAVRASGRAAIALAGGTTPRAVHEALATLPDIPWDAVHVYFGDERCVPAEHADSNFRMAKESLFDRVPIPSSQIHRPEAERADRHAAARAYEAILPVAFDLMLLGIGEDGHTASLFPGAPSLGEHERRCIPVIGPKPPPERLTLTPPVLESARALLMLAVGAGKAEAVARALEGPWDPVQTPAQLARRGSWLLDPLAAKLLVRR